MSPVVPPPSATATGVAHARAVFVNCPFDSAFEPSMDAIIFTIVCCGFEPRSALETDRTSESRMTRIVNALRGSHLSIHDLSRIYGSADTGLARMNMPLELGIAMALKLSYDKNETQLPHDWTALVTEGAPYQRAISDLNGHDLKTYDSRLALISKVLSWLDFHLGDPGVHFTPTDVMNALEPFDAELRTLRTRWPAGSLSWKRLVNCAREVVLADRTLRTS